MGKILLLEDNGLLSKDLIEELGICHYKVVHAYSYASAMDCWKQDKGMFDCIILDLNIDSSDLNAEEGSRYIPICGMAFLDNILGKYNFAKETENQKSILDKVIIYSGFTDSLKQRKRDFPYYDRLTITSKNAISISKLITKVEQIIKN